MDCSTGLGLGLLILNGMVRQCIIHYSVHYRNFPYKEFKHDSLRSCAIKKFYLSIFLILLVNFSHDKESNGPCKCSFCIFYFDELLHLKGH